MLVDSCTYDSTNDVYVLEDENGNIFTIEPYLDNPDYDHQLTPEEQPDVPQLIFPENFDVTGLEVQVECGLDNIIATEESDGEGGYTYHIELAGVLSGINWNSDTES